MRYSGSLMRYSFDEVKQNKSIVIVDTDDMSITLHTLHPNQTLEKYTATFVELMDPHFIKQKNDFLAFELKDETLIPHAIDQLRVLYPNLLQITYSYLLKEQTNHQVQSIQTLEQTDTPTLFQQFYKEMKNIELSPQQFKVVKELLEKVGEEHENS